MQKKIVFRFKNYIIMAKRLLKLQKNIVFRAKNWIIRQKYRKNCKNDVKIAVFLASNGLIIEKMHKESEKNRFLVQRKGHFQVKNG